MDFSATSASRNRAAGTTPIGSAEHESKEPDRGDMRLVAGHSRVLSELDEARAADTPAREMADRLAPLPPQPQGAQRKRKAQAEPEPAGEVLSPIRPQPLRPVPRRLQSPWPGQQHPSVADQLNRTLRPGAQLNLKGVWGPAFFIQARQGSNPHRAQIQFMVDQENGALEWLARQIGETVDRDASGRYCYWTEPEPVMLPSTAELMNANVPPGKVVEVDGSDTTARYERAEDFLHPLTAMPATKLLVRSEAKNGVLEHMSHSIGDTGARVQGGDWLYWIPLDLSVIRPLRPGPSHRALP